ncbi:MAG: hypothetical protein V1762_00670 [Nitrospirota bacterium]
MLIALLSLILAAGVIILLIESRPNLFMFQLINRIFGKERREEREGDKNSEGNKKSGNKIKLEEKEIKNV